MKASLRRHPRLEEPVLVVQRHLHSKHELLPFQTGLGIARRELGPVGDERDGPGAPLTVIGHHFRGIAQPNAAEIALSDVSGEPRMLDIRDDADSRAARDEFPGFNESLGQNTRARTLDRGVTSLLFELRHPSLHRCQPGTCRFDLLGTAAVLPLLELLARRVTGGLGQVAPGAGVIACLLGARARVKERLHPHEVAIRPVQVGLGAVELRRRLPNLLGPGSGQAQPQIGSRLVAIRPGRVQRQDDVDRIEPGQQLPGLHTVAFIRSEEGDGPRDLGGDADLRCFDIAGGRNLPARRTLTAAEDPRGCHDQEHRDPDPCGRYGLPHRSSPCLGPVSLGRVPPPTGRTARPPSIISRQCRM